MADTRRHTPGPWDFGYLEHNRYVVVIAAQGYGDVALCARNSQTGSCKGISMDQAKANARLIAAAPELLEALQELYPHIHDTAMEGESGFEKAWLKCEAAIRKATEEL